MDLLLKKIFTCVLYTFSIIYSVQAQNNSRITNDLNSYLSLAHSGKGFFGEILVAKGGEIFFHEAVGLSSIEQNVQLRKRAKFKIASITKTFTASLIEIAAREGKLDLQVPAISYISLLSPKFKDITVHQLLSHTSGLPHNDGIDDYWKRKSKLEMDTLSNIGISENSQVVIYDDKNGSNAAARFWWMLKAIGHEKVQVLNGGLQEAEKLGFPMSSEKGLTSQAKLYETGSWKLPIAELEEVEKASETGNSIIIDVREPKRYNGETEPIDPIAGHIPGAINFPFSENLDEKGLFLSPAKLKVKYENIFGNIPGENIIVHCGSGVTACHSLLAIAYAGLELPKLYVGSWSEWSRNNKNTETNTGSH